MSVFDDLLQVIGRWPQCVMKVLCRLSPARLWFLLACGQSALNLSRQTSVEFLSLISNPELHVLNGTPAVTVPNLRNSSVAQMEGCRGCSRQLSSHSHVDAVKGHKTS